MKSLSVWPKPITHKLTSVWAIPYTYVERIGIMHIYIILYENQHLMISQCEFSCSTSARECKSCGEYILDLSLEINACDICLIWTIHITFEKYTFVIRIHCWQSAAYYSSMHIAHSWENAMNVLRWTSKYTDGTIYGIKAIRRRFE